jgi:N-acetylmuramoyl-L-alanine amidase
MDTFRDDVKKVLDKGTTSTEQGKQKYYRVQIGAYSVKANAEAQLAKAKKAGFTDAYIKYE